MTDVEEVTQFASAMGELSGLVTPGALAAVDTAGVTRVVDIEGADGDFVLGLVHADPQLHGQALDLPQR